MVRLTGVTSAAMYVNAPYHCPTAKCYLHCIEYAGGIWGCKGAVRLIACGGELGCWSKKIEVCFSGENLVSI